MCAGGGGGEVGTLGVGAFSPVLSAGVPALALTLP